MFVDVVCILVVVFVQDFAVQSAVVLLAVDSVDLDVLAPALVVAPVAVVAASAAAADERLVAEPESGLVVSSKTMERLDVLE